MDALREQERTLTELALQARRNEDTAKAALQIATKIEAAYAEAQESFADFAALAADVGNAADTIASFRATCEEILPRLCALDELAKAACLAEERENYSKWLAGIQQRTAAMRKEPAAGAASSSRVQPHSSVDAAAEKQAVLGEMFQQQYAEYREQHGVFPPRRDTSTAATSLRDKGERLGSVFLESDDAAANAPPPAEDLEDFYASDESLEDEDDVSNAEKQNAQESGASVPAETPKEEEDAGALERESTWRV